MKKKIREIFVLLMIFCLTLSSMSIVSALNLLQINWRSYMSDVHKEGFYDTSGNDKLEYTETMGICLRQNEWVKYKVSGLEKGEYQISLINSSTMPAYLSVSVNDDTAISKALCNPTGDYNIFDKHSLGRITIDSDEAVITIKNVDTNATYFKEIIFESYTVVKKREDFLSKERPYIMSFLPCVIQAENFDAGKNGDTYYDRDDVNSGRTYRDNVGADIFESTNGNGYYVYLDDGDWLKYTFRTEKTDNYRMYIKAEDRKGDSYLRVYVDGYEVNTGVSGFLGEMSEIESGIYKIDEGVHSVVIKCIKGSLNLDSFRYVFSKDDGIDVSNTASLRSWSESQKFDVKVEKDEAKHPIWKEFYVSDKGNDNGKGTESSPYKTIEKVKAEVGKINDNMQGDIIVYLSGKFFVDETINFNREDSGTNGFDIIYKAKDEAVIHGGKKVEGFTKVNDTPLYVATIKDVDDFRQFYINDNRGKRARTKWLYWSKAEYDDTSKDYMNNVDGFVVDGDEFKGGFSKIDGMEMVWKPSWKAIRMPIAEIEKKSDGDYIIKLKQPYFDAALDNGSGVTVNTDIPFYLENAPEFLDEEGEWYFNKDTKKLYYYPFEYENMETAECYIPSTEVLMTLSGESQTEKIEHITFDGLTFRYGAWEEPTYKGFISRQADQIMDPDHATPSEQERYNPLPYAVKLLPAQIQVDFADDVNFVNGEFSHLGSVALSYENYSSNCEITGNLFDDTSAAAITLGEWTQYKESPTSEFCRDILVSNNLIRRVAVEYMTPGITAFYVYNVKIDHNDILDAPYSGISLGWGWNSSVDNSSYNTVSNNRVVNVLYSVKDGGNIYTLGTQKGTVFEGNYLKKSGEWKGGFYLDNATSYLEIRNNVIEDCGRWLKLTHSNLHDNVSYNNYSNTEYIVVYKGINPLLDEAMSPNDDGTWPQKAQDIINHAGLSAEYKYIENDYLKKENLRNVELERMPYDNSPGIVIPAGNNLYLEGGEGVAYHELLSTEWKGVPNGAPDVSDTYNGTDHHGIMTTLEGEWFTVYVDVTEDAEYELFAKVSSVNDKTAMSTWVDGKLLADKQVLKNTGDYGKFENNSLGKIYLTKGRHYIKFEHSVDNFGMYSFSLVKEGEKEKERNDGYVPEIIDAILK